MIYFVNRINEVHPVGLVVVETPSLKKTVKKKLRTAGLAGLAESFRNKLCERMNRRKHVDDCNKHFGDKWYRLDPQIDLIEVENINETGVQQRLEMEKPQIILDHGTSIVKKHILETADLALNLHWGLSPYYRGTACTEWALINWDPLNIGVTIHKLAKVIDGGDIVAQARADVSADDTVHSLNMQLTRLGTELIIETLDRIKAHREVIFEPQDYSKGYLTTNKQMTKSLRRQVEYIEKNGIVEIMLKKPARRKRLPIVEIASSSGKGDPNGQQS
jgi:methionyl-tRNA formyltransferase